MVRPTRREEDEKTVYVGDFFSSYFSNKKFWCMSHQYNVIRMRKQHEHGTNTYILDYITTRAHNTDLYFDYLHARQLNWTELNLTIQRHTYTPNEWHTSTGARTCVCAYVCEWCTYGLETSHNFELRIIVCVYRKRVHKINLHTFRTVNGSLPLQPQLQNI